jgi:hypothetical protein
MTDNKKRNVGNGIAVGAATLTDAGLKYLQGMKP